MRGHFLFSKVSLEIFWNGTVLGEGAGGKSRYRLHSFARALRALLSRAPDRTAMLRRLGVCREGMVTGQIEPCITHIGHIILIG